MVRSKTPVSPVTIFFTSTVAVLRVLTMVQMMSSSGMMVHETLVPLAFEATTVAGALRFTQLTELV